MAPFAHVLSGKTVRVLISLGRMKNSFKSTLVAALSMLALGSLLAQAQATTSLPTTVVTATRIEQPVTDIVADVSIIERTQIEQLGVGSVAELLARLPGVQASAYGDAPRVFLRGSESRMVALYIDGMRVDTQDGAVRLGGGAPWELLPLSQIERVEVLRGPASAVYGSDAMGGVVQIFTRQGEAGFHPYVNLGFGSYNTRKLSSGFSGAGEGWDYTLGLGIEDSDGFNTTPRWTHTPTTEAYTQRSSNFRLGRQLTTEHRLEFNALESRLDSRYVPWGGGTDYQAKAQLNTTGLKWRARWSDLYSTDLSVNRSRIAYRDDLPNDYVTSLQGIVFENRLRIGGGTVSAVLEEKNDNFEAQADGNFNPAFMGKRTQNALALGYSINQGAHALQLNARQDRDSLFGAFQTGAVAYGYSLAPNWRMTLGSGTAFRAPTLEQLFSQYGSATLKPETSRSYEAGMQYGQGPSAAKLVVYRNEISSMITSDQSLSTCTAGGFCYLNVDRATIQGMTLSANTQWGNYALRGSFDVLDPRNEVTGKDLNLRARQLLFFGVDRSVAQWRIGAEFKAVGERFDDAANSNRLPGYTVMNVTVRTALSLEWQLVGRLNNLADTKYEQVMNYSSPGRSFFIGLNWQPKQP